MKKLYEYDHETKELIGALTQYIDPLETIKAGKDIYIKVSNATDKIPPKQKEGFKIVYNGEEWEYIELPKPPEPEEPPKPTREELEAQREEIEYQEWKDKKLRDEFKAYKNKV